MAVERELATASAGLLGLDLGDVLVGAWRKHRALVAAAEATRDRPAPPSWCSWPRTGSPRPTGPT
jgi:hypothetical protein